MRAIRSRLGWFTPIATLAFIATACSSAAPAASPTAAKPAAANTSAPAPAAAGKPTVAAQPATSGAAAAPAAANAEWDKIVAAAKNEKVVVVTHPGAPYQNLIASFKKAYPDIPVEHSGERPSDISPKIITEQKNGVYNWDVMVASTSNMNNVLMPTGAFQPLPPLFVRDDIKDDTKWGGGKFEMYTSDKGPFVLIINLDVNGPIWINRDVVSKERFSKVDDLLKPEFQGKIVMDQPSVPAHGSLSLTGLLQNHGEDFVRKVLTTQKPVFQENVRITTEWVATGRYPIGIGVDKPAMDEFQANGIGKNVERINDDAYVLAQGVGVFKNAPHPNGSKVFLNWLLTQEGQQAFAESRVTGNSRRLDVAPLEPSSYPDYSKLNTYSSQGTDQGTPLLDKVMGMYKTIQSGG
jgi:ABC-type Fe3+ transport system substrate-binding protein